MVSEKRFLNQKIYVYLYFLNVICPQLLLR